MLNIASNEKSKIVFQGNEEAAFSEKFSQFITQKNVFQLAEEFNLAHFHIERNAYGKMVFLDLSFKVTGALHKHQ